MFLQKKKGCRFYDSHPFLSYKYYEYSLGYDSELLEALLYLLQSIRNLLLGMSSHQRETYEGAIGRYGRGHHPIDKNTLVATPPRPPGSILVIAQKTGQGR